MVYYFFLLFVFLTSCLNTRSQCVAPVAFPLLTCGSGTPLQDGANIASGQTHSFNGTGGAFSNITISGGTLLLCGSASITNVNFNSGDIVINAGATVTFNGSFNIGSPTSFHNAGNTSFNLNVTIQGASNFIYNAPGATITVNGSLTIFNSGIFVNDGTAIGQTILLNSGATICLGAASVSSITSLQNNATNPVSVPTGIACISYSSTFIGNAPITSSSALQICQNPGATNPDPVVVGAAIVFPNCPVCPSGAVTPLRLLSFNRSVLDGQANLRWATAYEENVRSFVIERSIDGARFDPIGEVAANNQPSVYTFKAPIEADSYYRLKMVDIDGAFSHSPVVVLKIVTGNTQFNILSNPVYKDYAELSIIVSKDQIGELHVVDYMGQIIKRRQVALTRGNNIIHLDLGGVIKGQYFINFTENGNARKVVPFVRL